MKTQAQVQEAVAVLAQLKKNPAVMLHLDLAQDFKELLPEMLVFGRFCLDENQPSLAQFIRDGQHSSSGKVSRSRRQQPPAPRE